MSGSGSLAEDAAKLRKQDLAPPVLFSFDRKAVGRVPSPIGIGPYLSQ